MKYVKILSLAVVAVAAFMAFVGASTASATVLCKTPGTGTLTGTTCPAGQAYSAGTEILAFNEGNVVLTTGSEFTEITCGVSNIEGHTTNEGSATETVRGSVLAPDLTFESCKTPNGTCRVETLQSGTLEIHWIEGTHNGTLTASGFGLTSSCASIFGIIHCVYETSSEDLGTITGGAFSTADIESTPINIISTSGLCPSGPKWDGKYNIIFPNPLYVTGHT